MEENTKPQENTTEIKKEEQKTKEDSNIIFIGNKPIINYVRSVSVQLNKAQGKDVIVRSRGKFISKAVDVIEISRRKFLEKENVKIKDIKIASESFEKNGKPTFVSTMDIVLGK
ncbi:MAG: RNA-binding protein [Candidatus Pacearchaeota archaeon]|nr:RNA-binding protein [Candidatus Pacearchaeota archaeon]